jgi:regulator of RNase E activity RraB
MSISESAIIESIQGHMIRNEALLQAFINKGVDPREPRTIECHFWACASTDAVNLAEALIALGFKILKQQSAMLAKDPNRWNIEVAIKQSIDITMRREFTEDLVRLAATHSAEYDGWGTSV